MAEALINAEPDNYPEILSDAAIQIAEALMAHGLDESAAGEIADAAAERMRTHWAGQLVYIPSGQQYEIGLRDAQILGEFNGRNHSQLARKYGLNITYIYRIVKRRIAEERDRRQGNLI
ncbi:probable bacteriophage transcriptional regulator [Sulfuriferula multivorans]|uniref:Probable bacteriophage transcriptional regulator n=1 Tax=Sulfuriferula multivorans TaxID=1559896 RepID=A0A401JF67_9PROT|nr:Mor transcription activator family protein [Sulfuriferula multivorans]GBL46256.1 probable bacteriophage transcriptional regulator [Sulfuriferula multivorans]